MGRLKDLALLMEEQEVPDFVREEASVSDALRLLGQDHVHMAKVNGRWAIVRAIPVTEVSTASYVPVTVVPSETPDAK